MEFRTLSVFMSALIISGCTTTPKEEAKEENLTIKIVAKSEVFVTLRKESDRTSLLHEVLKKDEVRKIESNEPVILYTPEIENIEIYRNEGFIAHYPSQGVVEFTID